VRRQFVVALLIATTSAAFADGTPAGGKEPTRSVSLMKAPGAPVVIDSAYLDVVRRTDAKHDEENVSCLRYRNVSSEPIVTVRFERTYFSSSRSRVDSDVVEDRKPRKPNRNAKPGTVPLAQAYWECTHTPNQLGATFQSVSIVPESVTFASGRTWHVR